MSSTHDEISEALARAGCVAADEEASELLAASSSQRLDIRSLVERRITGEPLAWITGQVSFCGLDVGVDPGVYVPRWQTEPMAEAAAAALPSHGVGIDLCTGAGAIAMVMSHTRPSATVMATDLDPAAVACARRNGVDALVGDLDAPLPATLAGRVDVVVAVVPYVPTEELHLLPRDVLTHEPRVAIDGGAGGTEVLHRLIARAPRWLRPGGSLFLEIGGDQADLVAPRLEHVGLEVIDVQVDDDGDVRSIAARMPV